MSFTTLLQRVQRGLSTVELIHTSHSRWPLPPVSPHRAPTLQISVLDSSFNPPTLAHLAIANLRPPSPPAPSSALASSSSDDFDARLLLLSVRNVDKQLKPGDATFEQRMEMMVLLAQDLARTTDASIPTSPDSDFPRSSSPHPETTNHKLNVAVAIINEPTFVGKSAVLLDFLHHRIANLQPKSGLVPPDPSNEPPFPKLTFLMGTDTIVRLFASRYYADEEAMKAALRRFLSPVENDSRLICARRLSKGVTGRLAAQIEIEIPDFLHDTVPADRIVFADIGERECTYSSSEVRQRIIDRDPAWEAMVTTSIAEYITDAKLYLLS